MIKDIGNNCTWLNGTSGLTINGQADVFGLVVDTLGFEGGAGAIRFVGPSWAVLITVQEGDEFDGSDMQDIPVDRSTPVVGGAQIFTFEYQIGFISNKRYVRLKFNGQDPGTSTSVSAMIFLYPNNQGPTE